MPTDSRGSVHSNLPVSIVVEGDIDEVVLSRIIWDRGGDVATSYGKRGKGYIEANIDGFASAAQHAPWAVMIDLDGESCAPEYLSRLGVLDHEHLCTRIVVREVEAWLMADRGNLAQFLGVRVAQIPADPESIQNPKGTLVNIARLSRRSAIRDALVPRPRSGRSVGAGYSERLMEFALDDWDLDIAMQSSPSLARASDAIVTLLGRSATGVDS
jgi:hypothetical protein